jgi:hypothetical protein
VCFMLEKFTDKCSLQGCAHPLHQSERERKREGEIERGREREKERERNRVRKWEREREYLFLKAIMGALAPISYLVYYDHPLTGCLFKKNDHII